MKQRTRAILLGASIGAVLGLVLAFMLPSVPPPAREMTSDDVECDWSTGTVTVKPGRDIIASSLLKACGWSEWPHQIITVEPHT